MDIQKTIENIREICEFDFIKVALAETTIGNYTLDAAYASGNVSNRYVRIVLQKRIGLAGLVLKTGRPHYIINADEEITPANMSQYPIILAEGLKSLGAAPIFYQQRVIGSVLAGFRSVDQMTPEKRHLFETEVSERFGRMFTKRVVKNEYND